MCSRSSGVSHSTFYTHFRDKEDLILAGYEATGTPSTKVTGIHGTRIELLDISTWLFSAKPSS
ncbi:TetR/AcrR family transcriptional regulator, partial [Pseudomonas sp.]|uniref:TetR/AcrR family transcriptional regulator n=1 Tax=Pseudomonas sp. TaxID=306 RepID=UPI00257CE04D